MIPAGHQKKRSASATWHKTSAGRTRDERDLALAVLGHLLLRHLGGEGGGDVCHVRSHCDCCALVSGMRGVREGGEERHGRRAADRDALVVFIYRYSPPTYPQAPIRLAEIAREIENGSVGNESRPLPATPLP